MSDNSVNCVFCGQKTYERIIKFTPEYLKKCMTVLEFRRTKPIRRKSRSTYTQVELSHQTLNDGYHAQCYKLFTAIKIPADFQKQQEEISQIESIPATSTTPAAAKVSGTTTDEAGVSNNHERELENSDDQFHAEMKCFSNEDSQPEKCFICEKSRKRHRGREASLAVNRFRTIELLKSAAAEHNDIEMLERISSFSNSSNIPYHKCCKDQYLRELSKGDDSDFIKKRKASKIAYVMLCEILQEYVVKKNEYLYFDDVKKEYHRLLVEQCNLLSDSISCTTFSDRHLEKKVMETFKKKIKIIYTKKKKFLAPFSFQIIT